MLDFISNCKQTIIKYKKQLLTFALIPVFIFRFSLSGFAAEVSPDAKTEWFLLPFNDISVQSNLVGSFNNTSGLYNATGYLGSGTYLNFTDYLSGGVFPSLLSGHRYLLYYNFTGVSDIDFVRIIIRKEFDDRSEFTSIYPLSHGSIVSNTDVYVNDTTTLSGIIDFVADKTISFSTGSALLMEISPYSNFDGRTDWAFYLLDITDNTESEVNQIVTAINNQTNNIMNAGSGYGGTSSGILSGNDELSGFIDDYTEIEQSMYDKFTENQSAVIGNFSGFSWGSLSTAVDWTSDYLNSIYYNSGDFRTMFMYPILSGIALIFIGRQGLTAYVRSRREK